MFSSVHPDSHFRIREALAESIQIAHISQEYIQAVKDIKSAILKSRYAAAKQANKELLKLYYSVGG